MAKESGLGVSVLSVDDSTPAAQTILNDITDFSMSTPRGVQDTTGIDKSAKEALLLLADYSLTLNGVFNDAANQSHAVFKTVPSTSVARTVTYTHSTQTLAAEILFTDYALTRGTDGSLVWTAPGVLATGVVPSWS
ncbi:hypothetical protein LCGC14_2090720 [marine sediment metagenome]|uniref:Uncharacterized protein n=1 Tax=marine sediment metagenome TaxID=412755 RepID=A0A0F9ED34_9ZZZZ